jgi:hypothetical protein
MRGIWIIVCKQHYDTFHESKYRKDAALKRCVKLFKRYEEDNIVNKTIFEEKWTLIRGLLNARWSLMVEYDLLKVDKAEVKFDKFVTMLQVKYGYTRQKAREEIGMLWAEYEANNRSNV